ncbi:hypothetical protein [Streptantibioticus ferralitis]|uniref:Uncharacterized protein n=1 Tax=Streptantibioticus ferralitis TaxID=236510 RepID=A0ABT5Z0C7_9ACTN|nr:hypothetical protein [Streptantibioticus ferralitis]MDF2257286.1 hypothetical protein [Streptantibioticus ferralitis]
MEAGDHHAMPHRDAEPRGVLGRQRLQVALRHRGRVGDRLMARHLGIGVVDEVAGSIMAAKWPARLSVPLGRPWPGRRPQRHPLSGVRGAGVRGCGTGWRPSCAP